MAAKREQREAKGEAAQAVVVARPPARVRRRRSLETVGDVARELRLLYWHMRNGEISCNDGTKLAFVLAQLIRIHETVEFDRRLTVLEARETERTRAAAFPAAGPP